MSKEELELRSKIHELDCYIYYAKVLKQEFKERLKEVRSLQTGNCSNNEKSCNCSQEKSETVKQSR